MVAVVGHQLPLVAAGIGRDGSGRLTSLTWTLPGGHTVTDTVTRSRAGRVLTNTLAETGQADRLSTYTYDTAARLASAALPGGRNVTYSFATSGGCGPQTNAGANTNRTSSVETVNGVAGGSTSYCYDAADRLTRTTGSLAVTPAYDARGNTTRCSMGESWSGPCDSRSSCWSLVYPRIYGFVCGRRGVDALGCAG